MLKSLTLFVLAFLLHTTVGAQTKENYEAALASRTPEDVAQSEVILGEWLLFEVRLEDGSLYNLNTEEKDVPTILTDVTLTKKKAVSKYRNYSASGKWMIKNGSLYFYFTKDNSEFTKGHVEQVYKVISVTETELRLQQNLTKYDGTFVTYTITYKRK